MNAALLDERIETILDVDDVDDFRQAMKLAATLASEFPREPRALAARARVLFKRGERRAAETDVSAALALDPHCADALWVRALLVDEDENELTVAELDRVLARQPDHYGCLMSRGWSLGQLGRTDEAVASCEAALRSRAQRRRPANNAVHLLMQAGRADEAAAFYERLAATHPEDGMIAYNAGTHYYQLEQYDKAIVHLDRGRRLLGEQNAIQHNRALTLQALGRHAEAVEEWSSVLRREPDWDWAVRGRERSLRRLGRTAEAEADLARWKEIVGDDSPEARTIQARRLIDADDCEGALHQLERTIAEGRADDEVFNLAGYCHARRDRHAKAKLLFERGLALRDDVGYLHRNYGETLLALDDPPGALAHSETAIALDPKDGRAYRLRGKALVGLGRPAEAVPAFERWAATEPERPAPQVDLIETLQALGRHAEALACCDELIRLSPADGWVHWRKGKSYEAIGNVANAKMAYQKAASSYLAAGAAGDAELCRKAAENAGERKRSLLSRLLGARD